MREIPVYNAKIRLSELLVQVDSGERVVITGRGVPVAQLVAPLVDDENSRRSKRERTADALAALALYRKSQSLGVTGGTRSRKAATECCSYSTTRSSPAGIWTISRIRTPKRSGNACSRIGRSSLDNPFRPPSCSRCRCAGLSSYDASHLALALRRHIPCRSLRWRVARRSPSEVCCRYWRDPIDRSDRTTPPKRASNASASPQSDLRIPYPRVRRTLRSDAQPCL